MDIALKITPPDWMVRDETQQIMRLLNDDNGQHKALFVGGCVRNAVLGKAVHDIDIATIHKAEGVMALLAEAGVKVIPTGIDHGTVTAVIGKHSFEITTLRHDVETDGRHAQVEFTQSWLEDAKRRDFTMNTLLADGDGSVYDPLACGVEDAKAGRVIFVGDPERRITEDYLRILRFFRFHAYYGVGDMDEGAVQACAKHAPNISSLSRERVTQEFLKITLSKNASEVVQKMFENNVLGNVIDLEYQQGVMHKLIEAQARYDAFMVEPRLYVVAGNKPRHYNEELRLTNATQNFLVKLQITQAPHFYDDETALKRAIFYHGRDLVLQGYLLRQAIEGRDVDEGFIDIIKSWDIPKFTVTGQDLMKEGYQTGPELGEELERRKKEWIERTISS